MVRRLRWGCESIATGSDMLGRKVPRETRYFIVTGQMDCQDVCVRTLKVDTSKP